MNAKSDPALERQRDIFLKALEKPSPAEQAAYLDGACGDDLALRAQVAALLQHHTADSFLERPPAGGDTLRPGAGFVSEGPGSVIGRYKLLQKIGEGGMGAVYMAEQTEPVRRKVALKIIKPGLDTRQVIARFEAERQALALMDHPNIAKVLDAGATGAAEAESSQLKAHSPDAATRSPSADRKSEAAAGRPYFVMDLVQGVPITEYCDKNHLSTLERLELFIPVCQAIHHAHQKGIIHRDIKPSNVMVTLHDGKPVPKVIDFGVAKAINQRLTEKTLFTHYATMIGTPAYMSPEQAEMSGLDVDTRTDVYALGVLLYELLTGTTPFPQKELLSLSYGEMQRVIAEKEPPKPSTRLSTLQGSERALSAKNRSTEASALGKQCQGDLDWIVLKALEKDRTRRYETVNGLVADIHRHIRNEPVSAAAPTLAYQFQKFYRRRRLLVHATAGLAALLVLGILATTWQAVRATRAEQRAEAERGQAVIDRDRARTAEDAAKEERRKALEEKGRANAEADRASRWLYTANMNLAKRAWDEANVGRVVELLDLHRPQSGQADLRNFEWFYLDRLCHSDLLTLRGHTKPVISVAFSPDGNRLASASNDKMVKVWNALSGQETLTFKGHTEGVGSVAFSPDGKQLASASYDQTVKVWDATSGQETLTFKGHSDQVISVAFSPDGKRLASAGEDKTVKVWDTTSGQETLTLRGHTNSVVTVAFSPDGKRLASASGDQTLKLWDLTSGQEALALKGHCGWVWRVAFSPDGKRLASASSDQTVKVWDAMSGQETFTLKGHTDVVTSVAFSPDGKRLVSAGWDGTVKVWDATSGQETLTLKGHTDGIDSVAFSPDGNRLASASEDGTVKVWDATSEKVWDATSEQEVFTLKGHTSHIFSLAFSPDGKRLASASGQYGEPGEVRIWDATTSQEMLTLKGHTDGVDSVVFSPDGKRLASASADRTVKVWDASTGQETLTLQGHTGVVTSVAFSPDGKRLASASEDEMVKVWDAMSGQETLTLKGHSGDVWSVVFSPDGKRLASASVDQTAVVWDAMSGQEILTLRGHTKAVGSVVFSPDGKRLASASLDRTVKLWDAASGQETLSLKGHTPWAPIVTFSPDGKRLASASIDGTVKVWDARPRPEASTPEAKPQ
jgi:WD40 repeat protein/serine/threonine protein kinase